MSFLFIVNHMINAVVVNSCNYLPTYDLYSTNDVNRAFINHIGSQVITVMLGCVVGLAVVVAISKQRLS